MSDLHMDVRPYGGGKVLLTLGSLSLTLEPEAAAELRELLDRAAMPGQPPPAEAALTREEIDRCGDSEDPYHRCRVCYDYAAGREREHPLTAPALCDQSAPGPRDDGAWTCTERLGHDDKGWHYDPVQSKWWRRTPDGTEAVKDPRDRAEASRG